MSPEFDDPRRKVDNPHNFYEPINNELALYAKLTSILNKSEISDRDLFEAIADTFSTNSAQIAKCGQFIVSKGQINSLHFCLSEDDVEINSKGSKTGEYVSFFYEKISPTDQLEREESCYLGICDIGHDSEDPLLIVKLNRDGDGSIENLSSTEEEGEMKQDPVEDSVRRKIITIFLEGNRFDAEAIDSPTFNLN